MAKPLPRLSIVHCRDPQLQRVNEKIAALAAMKPWDQVYATLASSARLAAEAIQAAKELQQLPRNGQGSRAVVIPGRAARTQAWAEFPGRLFLVELRAWPKPS